MLITLKRFCGNFFLSIFPSSCFAYRRWILKFMGITVCKSVKVNIGFKIYGRGDVYIDENVWIGPNCHIYTAEDKGIRIGKNCDIAPEVCFICGSHLQNKIDRRAGDGTCQEIVIGDGTWICAKTTIHASIGKMVIVGSGAVILDDIPDNVLVAGIPAKIKKVLK